MINSPDTISSMGGGYILFTWIAQSSSTRTVVLSAPSRIQVPTREIVLRHSSQLWNPSICPPHARVILRNLDFILFFIAVGNRFSLYILGKFNKHKSVPNKNAWAKRVLNNIAFKTDKFTIQNNVLTSNKFVTHKVQII